MPADCQTQPQAPVNARRPSITLTETLEQMRQEFHRDADAVVRDGHLDVRVDTFQPNLDPARPCS